MLAGGVFAHNNLSKQSPRIKDGGRARLGVQATYARSPENMGLSL